MSIWTPGQPSRQQQRKQLQQQQQKLAEYGKRVNKIADEIMKVLIDNDCKVVDYNNIGSILSEKFNNFLSEQDIKEIERSLKNNNNQGNS